MMTNPIYRFNKASFNWESTTEITVPTSSPKALTVLNFNVLFDKWRDKDYRQHVAKPLERYQYQFQKFQELDADIIILNEVTSNYIRLITQEKWVQENYFCTDVTGDTILHFGNIILSKFPIHQLLFANLSQLKRPVPCASFLFDNQIIVFAATHLTAQIKNHDRRQIQVNELTDYLDSFYPTADKVILGDLNYHVEKEIIPPHYTDVWKKLKPTEAGFTFDGTKNTMIHELWPLGRFYGFKDDVQMRLDRVFTRTQHWQATSIDICFNEPVYEAKSKPNLFKDILSTIFDKLKINIIRNPKHYLFPSDHFGLMTIFEFS